MRCFLPLLCLFLLATPALAAESDAKGGAPGTNIDMPFLMAPMNGADGNLAGYAYISTRVTTLSDAGATSVRDKIAFIQDAFVRDVNGVPIARADDPAQVDMAGLQSRLLSDARKIMGGGKIASLAIVQVQIAPLHPKQTPNESPPPDSAQTAPVAPKNN